MYRITFLVLLISVSVAINAISRKQIDPSKVPRARVELHLHLDGAIRVSTVWELAKEKNITFILNAAKSYEELSEKVRSNKQESLGSFLEKFALFSPVIVDDLIAIERVAYELCEDQANEGVVYFEARYSPHLLISKDGEKKGITAQDVVEAVNRGMQRGQNDFKVKARTILCCIFFQPENCDETVSLAFVFQNVGVVGIDCAAGEPVNGEPFPKEIVEAFKKAQKAKVHRTVHAGETPNSSANVNFAVNEMFAERIGHGYHVVENQRLYEELRKRRTHFEVCPYSSYVTGGVTSNMNNGKHPIVQFAEDDVSFSISKDDPTIIQTTLDDEYDYLTTLGLNEVHFFRANYEAAQNTFLPENEADRLIKDIINIYTGQQKVLSDFL